MDRTPTNPSGIDSTALRQRMDRLLAGPRETEKPFVISGTTYGALYNMAAHIRAGCAGESWVYLCAGDRGVVAAALLAALTGGPALILPYTFDLNVLAALHRRTGFRCVVSDESGPVPAGVRRFIPAPAGAAWPPADPVSPRPLDDAWLQLFTGGSTGTPQIWTKTVRNLLAETLSIVSHYRVTPEDRLAATVVPNHIYGLLYAVLTPLLASAAVAPGTPSFPSEIETTVRRSEATILVSVPAHYRAMNGHPFNAPSLRLAFSSAGLLAAEDAAAFNTRSGVPVVEVYGSTETGGIAERVRARGDSDFTPFDPVAVRIAHDRLMVRSDYLSPELPLQSDGYFETGDRAKANAGNRFELLGRADGIVKVAGQRVDLAAVAQALKRHPGVRDAVAISTPVPGGRENRIVAVVEADTAGVTLDDTVLETLAPYARPRSIKVLAKIPMTPAGKVDRKSIEQLFQ